MSNTAMRRMYTDIKQFQAAKLESDGIFCSFNEDDLFDVKAMVVGPRDTPYEDGFYFFRLAFPKNYPFAPPKAVFETRYNTAGTKLRFNPNLYANGKVCVSLLGTWSGPQWEPCQSLYSILLAFQTLLTEEPLRNEPGYVTITPSQADKHKHYTEMVAYENYRVAILRMLDHPPEGFEAFIPIMQQWTYQRAAAIGTRLAAAVEATPEARSMTCRVYHAFATVVDYPKVQADFAQVRTQLEAMYGGVAAVVPAASPAEDSAGAGSAAEAVASANATGVTTTTSAAPPDPVSSTAVTVEAEVEAAVQAFASTTLSGAAPTPAQATAKPKRKRPNVKARDCHYQVLDVPQPDGHLCRYQAVPSEYTVKSSDAQQPPAKRTRWLWRRVHAKCPAVADPLAAAGAGTPQAAAASSGGGGANIVL